MLKGIRGAISVDQNTSEAIIDRTKELLIEIDRINHLDISRIASVFFTLTPDLNATFPAVAARLYGWTEIPLICAQEIDVPGALPKCIRVLIHYNVLEGDVLVPVYLGEAIKLRKDLSVDKVDLQ